MSPQSLRLLAVLAAAVPADLAAAAPADAPGRPEGELPMGPGLADYLWHASMPLVNQSLHGRFVSQMVDGTLPKSAFLRYLAQDNLYLTKYARAFAVIGARAEQTDEMAWAVNQSLQFLREHGIHSNRGVDEATFARHAMPVTVAYTSHSVEAAWSESLALAYAAVIPCARLYDWLFSHIKATMTIKPDNPYKAYIDQYAAVGVDQVTRQMEAYFERHVEGMSPGLLARLEFNYNTAMRYEAEFFEQGFGEMEGIDDDNDHAAVMEALGLLSLGKELPLGRRRPPLGGISRSSESVAASEVSLGMAMAAAALGLGSALAACCVVSGRAHSLWVAHSPGSRGFPHPRFGNSAFSETLVA